MQKRVITGVLLSIQCFLFSMKEQGPQDVARRLLGSLPCELVQHIVGCKLSGYKPCHSKKTTNFFWATNWDSRPTYKKMDRRLFIANNLHKVSFNVGLMDDGSGKIQDYYLPHYNLWAGKTCYRFSDDLAKKFSQFDNCYPGKKVQFDGPNKNGFVCLASSIDEGNLWSRQHHYTLYVFNVNREDENNGEMSCTDEPLIKKGGFVCHKSNGTTHYNGFELENDVLGEKDVFCVLHHDTNTVLLKYYSRGLGNCVLQFFTIVDNPKLINPISLITARYVDPKYKRIAFITDTILLGVSEEGKLYSITRSQRELHCASQKIMDKNGTLLQVKDVAIDAVYKRNWLLLVKHPQTGKNHLMYMHLRSLEKGESEVLTQEIDCNGIENIERIWFHDGTIGLQTAGDDKIKETNTHAIDKSVIYKKDILYCNEYTLLLSGLIEQSKKNQKR